MFYSRFWLPYIFALRIITWSKAQSYVNFLTKLCFLGIMVGSASLALTLMIMNGFEKQISQKICGVSSQAIISAKNAQTIAWRDSAAFLAQNCSDLVESASATSTSQVVLDHEQNFYHLILKAVDKPTFAGVSNLDSKIFINSSTKNITLDLAKLLHGNTVIIGHKFAENLNLKLGDTLKILLPEPSKKKTVKLREVKVVLTGFLDVGLNEYDAGVLLCSLDLFWEFFGNQNQVEQILLKFSQSSEIFTQGFFQKLLRKIAAFLPWTEDHETLQVKALGARLANFKVQSWKELYPALVSSLRLEKYAMFFVLMLVSIVAIMNMIALLVVLVQAKRKDIAILRTLGFDKNFIQRIFISFGLMLTFVASATGLALAYFLGWFFSAILPIKLPDAYLVANLPFDLALAHFSVVFFVTMLVGLFASWWPARQTADFNVVDILRNH